MARLREGVRVPVGRALALGWDLLATVHICCSCVEDEPRSALVPPQALPAPLRPLQLLGCFLLAFGATGQGTFLLQFCLLEWDGSLSLELLPPLRSPGGRFGRLQGHPVFHG